ncbi:MAG TPA: tetratricopeptide repeat protein [Streptosporangiaceae bacterium]
MTARDAAHQLEEFSSFVGRDRELAELLQLAGPARALTLAGAGGIGKTRLALRVFGRLAGAFPDGAWYVDLSELSQPDQVVPRVAAALGVAEEPGRPLLETLADTLRPRRALLALDNCEHLIGACASLCQRLLTSAPGLKVLATSREPLRVAAESVWQVPPLSLPPASAAAGLGELRAFDAIALFAERASAASPSFALTAANAAGVAAICRMVDGLPLAIELAAAWTRVLSVDQIADRLSHRLELLTSGDRSVPARQQTLRAAFDWSYELLSPPEQLLLRRLSAFAAWSLEMAETVCADEQLRAADILDLMTALADKSLIEVEPDALGEARYRMLETVREYAAGWLAEAGESEEFHRRHRAWVVRQCEYGLAVAMATTPAPWSARVEQFRRYDLELANLHEMLAECVADGDAASGLRICAAMRLVWIVRGTLAEGAAWMDSLLQRARDSGLPDGVVGPAEVGRAQLALASGSAHDAEDLAVAGLQACRAAGVPSWVAAALNVLAETALHARRLDDADEHSAEAVQAARSAGDRWNEGYALGTRAAIAAARGNLAEAERLARESLAILDDIEQLWGSARALLGLGDLARLRADHEAARQHYLKALEILRELDARPDIARCLAGLGQIAIAQSDLPAARQHLSRGLQLSYLSGSRIGMARGLEAIATLAVAEQRPQVAVQLAGAVSALRLQAGLPPAPGARTQRLLDAAAGLGEPATARLWAAGTAMPAADAVQLALSVPGDGEAAAPVRTDALARPSADGPAGLLTQREREVVTLLGAGLSNRAIASELVISPATAARHVANILAKLGFSSRSQVAVWAATAADPAPGR